MLLNQPASAAIDFDYRFWAHPETWPHDPPGHVFFARAFQEIGRATYGARWIAGLSGQEPEEPADECDDATWDQYERDCDQAEADFQNMRSAIAPTIAQQCEAKNLVSALRRKLGGQMATLEPHLWNTECFAARFFRCDMSLDDPFTADDDLPRQYWIYVTRESLDRYLSGQLSVAVARVLPEQQRGTEASVAGEPFSQPRAHRRELVKNALITLYGPTGVSLGVTEERRHQDVNGWLRKNGEPKGVSKATIRRAIRDVRDKQANRKTS